MPSSVNYPGKAMVDGGYQYYKKDVDAVEQDYKKQLDHHREKEDTRAVRAQEALASEREKIEARAATAIKAAKENANDVISRDRDLSKREIERVKAQTYDKFGRYQGNEADVIKQQLSNTKDTIDDMNRNHKRTVDNLENTYATRAERKDREKSDEIEQVVKTQRDALAAASDYERNARKEMERNQAYESQRKYQMLDEHRISEVNAERNHTKDAIEDLKDGYATRMAQYSKDEDYKNEKIRDSFRLGAERSINNQRNAHRKEVNELRSEVKEMTTAAVQDHARLGEATQRYERENARDNQRQLERVVADRDMNLERARDRVSAAEDHHEQNSREMIRDKENFYADVVRNQTDEAFAREKELRETYERSFEEMQIRARKDREQASEAMVRNATEASEDRDKALTYQARAYNDTSNRERKNKDDQINMLQTELQRKNTSSDPNDISPSAEAAVRNAVTREYEKTYAVDRERTQQALDSTVESYQNRMQDAISDQETMEADRTRRMTADHHRERADLLFQVQDSETRGQMATRDIESQSEREKEKLIKSYSSQMERQRKTYEGLLEKTKNDGQNNTLNARREADLQFRLIQRQTAADRAELVRGYERQLADQKVDFDAKIADVKSASELATRELERNHRTELEQQAKNYEFRIAQLDQQQKERERHLASTYENQLERNQRANERIAARRNNSTKSTS